MSTIQNETLLETYFEEILSELLERYRDLIASGKASTFARSSLEDLARSSRRRGKNDKGRMQDRKRKKRIGRQAIF
jgi:hypothetical protein